MHHRRLAAAVVLIGCSFLACTENSVTSFSQVLVGPRAAFEWSAVDLTVSFSDESTHSSGSIVAWSWDFGDGSASSTSQNPSHTYGAAGTYTVVLTVTDDADATNEASQSVSVSASPGGAPVAAFTTSTSDLTASFTDQSTDADGSVVAWSWDFGDGSATSTAQNPSHTYGAAGTYTVTLEVTDDDGLSDEESQGVTVSDPTSAAPTAAFAWSATGLAVSFTDQSTDSDGNVVAWAWDFGDGSGGSSEQNPAHTYGAAGSYVVTLTVTDNDGDDDSATRTVSVSPPGSATAAFSSTFQGADVTDNGKWVETMGYNNPSITQVFTSALDPDVPGGRGLRLIGNNGDDFWLNFVPAASVRPPVPSIGEAITWRWYWKLISGDGDQGYHPVAWGGDTVSPPPEGMVITYTVVQGGGWTPWLQVYNAGATPDYQPRLANADRLQPNVWYRHELTWIRETSNRWSLKFRIYDPAGTVVYQTSDFFDGFGGGSNRLDALLSTQPNANFSTEWTGFGNGVGGTVGSPHEQDRWAAIVAVMGDVTNIPFPITGEGS